MWSLNEPGIIGADWGIGVKVPLQPSELGIASLLADMEGTLSRDAEWDFRLGGLIQSYRTGRPSLGVYYSLRHFPFVAEGALNGIGVRYGPVAGALYPELWNPLLQSDGKGPVLVIEPGWFSGLYLQFRYAVRPGAGQSMLRLAVGLEEYW